MVRCVGEVLGLKADGIPGGVVCAVLARRDRGQEVGRVQVDARQGRQHLHADAGLGADSPGGVAQTAVPDDIALIVAAAIGQRGEIRADVQPQRLFLGEVHRGALDRQLAPGGDAGGVGLEVRIGVQRHAVAQRTAAGVAVQVKIAVVRHIADGGRVGGRPVADDQPALGQAVLNGQIKIAGEAVCPGGARGRHRHAVGLAGGQRHVKQRVVEPVQTAVQAVAVLVRRDVDDLLIQRELRARNAVGKAAHGGAHAVGVQLIVGGGVVAQHDVHGIALAVFYDDAMDNGGVAQQLHLDEIVFQRRQLNGLAAGGLAEILNRNGHGGTLLIPLCRR